MVTHGGPDPRTALWRSRAGRESTLESLSVDNVRFLMHRRLLRPGPRLDSARHPLRYTGARWIPVQRDDGLRSLVPHERHRMGRPSSSRSNFCFFFVASPALYRTESVLVA